MLGGAHGRPSSKLLGALPCCPPTGLAESHYLLQPTQGCCLPGHRPPAMFAALLCSFSSLRHSAWSLDGDNAVDMVLIMFGHMPIEKNQNAGVFSDHRLVPNFMQFCSPGGGGRYKSSFGCLAVGVVIHRGRVEPQTQRGMTGDAPPLQRPDPAQAPSSRSATLLATGTD